MYTQKPAVIASLWDVDKTENCQKNKIKRKKRLVQFQKSMNSVGLYENSL